MRCLLAGVFVVLAYAAVAQPVYITGGGGIESGTIDTRKLGYAPYDDYYSNAYIKYFTDIQGEFSRYYLYHLGFKNDPFWQNTINGDIGFKLGVITIMLGVQVGMFDIIEAKHEMMDIEYWDLGINADIKIEVPGYFFIRGNLILNIGGNWTASNAGSTHRQLMGFSGGFWLPHILISGGYEQKDYDEIITAPPDIEQASRAGYTIFFGRLEFFAKNIPFRLGVQVDSVEQKANWRDVSGYWKYNLNNVPVDNYLEGGVFFNIDFGRHLTWSVNAKTMFSGIRVPAFSQFSVMTGLTFVIEGNS